MNISSSLHVSFIGLGSMGLAMARNLQAAGFALTVFNRSVNKADELRANGAIVAGSPSAAVSAGSIVVSMVANDAVLEELCLGVNGFSKNLGKGGIHVSMSTVSPETSRRLAKAHAAQGSLFIAAPVFGRPDAAAARKLWICQSGSAEAKERVKPVLEALSQGVYDFGDEPGAANVVKLCGNFMILAASEAMAEALALGEKNGIDRQALIGFFGQTNFACPIYQNYGRIIAERNFSPAGFKLELGAKDIRLTRESAQAMQVAMPLADLLNARLIESLNKGRAQLDWTAIELSIAEAAGLVSKV